MHEKVAVIIPVYNEQGQIGKVLDKLLNIVREEEDFEILIVDGGSTDATEAEVTSRNVRFLRSPLKGRAAQMNFGVTETTGGILYFLHADTIPPADIIQQIRWAVRAGYESGCSRLVFDENRAIMKLYAWFTRFDLLPFRYGDQGLYVTRAAFEQAGPYREELLVMEDNELIRLLRKRGTFTILQNEVVTSARKYRENGFLRLQLIFAVIFVMHYIGASQEMLVRFYRDMVKGTKV